MVSLLPWPLTISASVTPLIFIVSAPLPVFRVVSSTLPPVAAPCVPLTVKVLPPSPREMVRCSIPVYVIPAGARPSPVIVVAVSVPVLGAASPVSSIISTSLPLAGELPWMVSAAPMLLRSPLLLFVVSDRVPLALLPTLMVSLPSPESTLVMPEILRILMTSSPPLVSRLVSPVIVFSMVNTSLPLPRPMFTSLIES